MATDNKERKVVVFIQTSGEISPFDDHMGLIKEFDKNIECKKFCCILCAHEYLKKNHKETLLVCIRPYGTICSHSIHTKEDIEKYTQLKGVCNFYEMLINSDDTNQIPCIIMQSNDKDGLKPPSQRPSDIFMDYVSFILPTEFVGLIKKLKKGPQ
ncbi:MAG: hypothetical protein PHH83_01270 [Patescibacteria group bacterium]|nr:hypothetical protein [Patescibacteria group bacterium]